MTGKADSHPSIFNEELILKGMQFALHAHQGQDRKVDGQPYYFHPLAVGRLLMEAGQAADVVVAGLLHDVVEDTAYSINDIEDEFGRRIAQWVNAVTEPDKDKPWRERKQAVLDTLVNAEEEVVLIALADKMDNLRSLRAAFDLQGPTVWGKFNRPKPDQRWYYQSLISLFSKRVETSGGLRLLQGLSDDFEYLFGQ